VVKNHKRDAGEGDCFYFLNVSRSLLKFYNLQAGTGIWSLKMFGCSVRQDCGPNLALVGCYCLVLPVSVTILAEKATMLLRPGKK